VISVSIRPESIRLVPRAGGTVKDSDNCISGRVAGVTFLGASRRVDVVTDGVNLQVTTAADLPLPADGEVDLLFAPERTVALPGKVS
jgi:ABC-type Fe3+/spermidine/putrescine transport system ATPase subunit